MIESVLAGRSQDRDEALKRAEITYEPCWMCAISVLDPESYLFDRRYCEADKGSPVASSNLSGIIVFLLLHRYHKVWEQMHPDEVRAIAWSYLQKMTYADILHIPSPGLIEKHNAKELHRFAAKW